VWQVSIFLPSSPQFQAGIHPKGNQDGCPIENVGHDADEEKFPINIVGHDKEEKIPVPRLRACA
jgi:hypothetical protein